MLTRKSTTDYSKLHVWELYQAQLETEYQQCLEEGLDIAPYHALISAVAQMPPGEVKESFAEAVFQLVQTLPMRQDADLCEPDDLEDIRMEAEGGCALPPVSMETLYDRVHGAWLGRICGCLLGKPLEGKMTEDFLPLLRATGNEPLHRYITAKDLRAFPCDKFSPTLLADALADQIECAPVDDDTNYTVMSGEIVERHGRDFTPEQVAETWLSLQGKDAYCTAERVAYRNLVAGLRPPYSARYMNPYREWIGAQIRVDYYGYINPGDPAAAAAMAWRDASISHTKNGIYGAMYAAAVIAAAAVCTTGEELVRAGLAQLPVRSRLYRAVKRLLELRHEGSTTEELLTDIAARYNEHNIHEWTHTISNAEIVTVAVLYGMDSFEHAMRLAVQPGFDTDCNGATVGSVFGMLHGAASIPAQWTQPLYGMLNTSIFGVGKVAIQQLVDRTLRHMAQPVPKGAIPS